MIKWPKQMTENKKKNSVASALDGSNKQSHWSQLTSRKQIGNHSYANHQLIGQFGIERSTGLLMFLVLIFLFISSRKRASYKQETITWLDVLPMGNFVFWITKTKAWAFPFLVAEWQFCSSCNSIKIAFFLCFTELQYMQVANEDCVVFLNRSLLSPNSN